MQTLRVLIAVCLTTGLAMVQAEQARDYATRCRPTHDSLFSEPLVDPSTEPVPLQGA